MDTSRCLSCSNSPATKFYCISCYKSDLAAISAEKKKLQSKLDFLKLKRQPEASGVYDDVIILQAADGERLPVNHLVLTSRSRVFEAMLKVDMIERQTKTIQLQDINSIVLHAFVDFLYSAEVSADDMKRHSSDLLLTAHKYEVDLLKRECENFMNKYLNAESVLRYLEVAYLVDSVLVKDAAFSFIILNWTEKELESERFLNLAYKHPRIVVELCRRFLINRRRFLSICRRVNKVERTSS